MKTNYLWLLLGLCATLSAQYPYEPSSEHPYGLPNPEAPKELLDFAQLIGECDCKSQARNADQSWAEPIDMVWRFKYILNGMGIQDETLKDIRGAFVSLLQIVLNGMCTIIVLLPLPWYPNMGGQDPDQNW